jgi:uncharacterized phage protein gp47/JayE
MKPTFTNSGVSVRTFDEIYNELADAYREIYGADINLDQSTPDGQKLGIFAKQILDLETYGLNLYSQMDPELASGEMLNSRIKILGISRKPATQSTVEVVITTDRSVTLPAGYSVADENGMNWITKNTQSLVSGANTVTLYAEEYGSISALANTVTEPNTIVLGVQSITNPNPSIDGNNEETDQELRLRRTRSLEIASQSTIGALYSKLSELELVTQVVIYENNTQDFDTERQIPSHSIWCIIEGGAVNRIVEVMTKNKPAGVGVKGQVAGTYIEEIPRFGGGSFFFNHEMRFDRPVYVPIFVRLKVKRKFPTEAINIDAIKENIVKRVFGINQNAVATSFYSEVYQSGNNFIATDIELSDDGVTYTDELLESNFDEIFKVEINNILITEVV